MTALTMNVLDSVTGGENVVVNPHASITNVDCREDSELRRPVLPEILSDDPLFPGAKKEDKDGFTWIKKA